MLGTATLIIIILVSFVTNAKEIWEKKSSELVCCPRVSPVNPRVGSDRVKIFVNYGGSGYVGLTMELFFSVLENLCAYPLPSGLFALHIHLYSANM